MIKKAKKDSLNTDMVMELKKYSQQYGGVRVRYSIASLISLQDSNDDFILTLDRGKNHLKPLGGAVQLGEQDTDFYEFFNYVETAPKFGSDLRHTFGLAKYSYNAFKVFVNSHKPSNKKTAYRELLEEVSLDPHEVEKRGNFKHLGYDVEIPDYSTKPLTGPGAKVPTIRFFTIHKLILSDKNLVQMVLAEPDIKTVSKKEILNLEKEGYTIASHAKSLLKSTYPLF